MYELSVPVTVYKKSFDPESVRKALEEVGATRIILAIPPLKENNDDQYALLRENIAYFKKYGYKTAVWFWAFWVDFKNDFTMVHGSKSISANSACPLDEKFLAFARKNIQTVASMDPEMILFDDDLRLGYMDSGYGCVCENHRALIKEYAGDCPENIYEAAFAKEPNKYRDAFLKAQGESLKRFCQKMRQAVDEINPAVRIGVCGCISTWDADGVDSFTLAKILAGNTRPYLRQIGAPYWAVGIGWGNRLQDVVELERMERAWIGQTDAEIVPEGDAFPRPRFATPASFMEIFDTGLRFSGGFTGIQKYILDYTSSERYERGYINETKKTPDLSGLIAGTESVGIRVWESMNKIKDAEIDRPLNEVPDMIFSEASRMLAGAGIPTTYDGLGTAGIVFGENARQLPEEALSRPLILDLKAAKILKDKGVDVGFTEDAGTWTPEQAYSLQDDDYFAVFNGLEPTVDFAHLLTLKPGAEVLAEYVKDDERHPAIYRYGKFIVFAYERGPVTNRRNYLVPRILANALPKLPAAALGHPDLYLQAREGDGTLVIGVWNCHPDYIENLVISTAKTYKNVSFMNASGHLEGDKIVMDLLPAYGYAFIKVTE